MSKNNYAVIVDAICEWMKRHTEKFPDRAEIAKCIDIPENLNYTICKKRAYKKLEKDGYILHYESDTNAKIIGYQPPENIGKKVAEKMLGIEPESELDFSAAKPEPAPEKRPVKGIFVLNETVSKQECSGIGKIIEALAEYPGVKKLTVKIQIIKAE